MAAPDSIALIYHPQSQMKSSSGINHLGLQVLFSLSALFLGMDFKHNSMTSSLSFWIASVAFDQQRRSQPLDHV